MYALEGGSVGFQIGGQATDLVLLIMNERGASSILNSKVKLGGDASVAAGPVGRDASANTDAYMRAEVLSYSRSRGLFAGISLEGSTLRPDDDATADVYGRKLTARQIVLGGEIRTPASGRHLVAVLQKNSPRNESKESAGEIRREDLPLFSGDTPQKGPGEERSGSESDVRRREPRKITWSRTKHETTIETGSVSDQGWGHAARRRLGGK